jgi:hypothetical protein
MSTVSLIITILKLLASAWTVFEREQGKRAAARADADLESDLNKIRQGVKDAQNAP